MKIFFTTLLFHAAGLFYTFSQTQSDISYGSDVLQKLDYYSASTANSPILIVVHGGGWFTGSKNGPDYQTIAQLLNNEGYAVVNINYRLTASPNFVTYPTHIEDLACALAWTKNNASSMNGDSSRVAVYGHSAGGQISAYLGVRPLSSMLSGCSNTSGLNVDGVMLTSATVDFDMTNPANWQPILNMLGDSTQFWYIAQPINHCSNNFGTKFLILCGEFDNLWIGQDSAFHDSLISNGHCSVLKMFAGKDHNSIISGLTSTSSVFVAMRDFLDSLWGGTLCPPTEVQPEPLKANYDFVIFPNPTNGRFTVMSDDQYSFKIYNIYGATVHQATMRNKQESIVLDLPEGIYFIQMIPIAIGTEQCTQTKKLEIIK